MESCEDYQQSLQVKYHLAYLVGEVLIGAKKLRFNLRKSLKETKQIYEIHQHYKQILKSLQLPYVFIDNPKDLNEIISLLQIHSKILPNHQFVKFLPLHQSKFLIQEKSRILQWLQSKEFKESYLDTHHPYPPLLNPKTIDYQIFPTQLAWKINLPFPQNYKFVFLARGVSGHAALWNFLSLCGVHLTTLWVYNRYLSDDKYLQNDIYPLYNKILSCSSNSQCIVFNAWFKPNHKYFLKQARLLNAQCPLLFLVRDPISRLKSAINHGNSVGKSSFCMGEDLSLVLDKKRYCGNNKEINPESLARLWQDYDFRDNTMLSWFANKEVYYLDMQEIMPNHAFETMKRLSQKLRFSAPKQEQSKIFERIFWDSALTHLLPLTLKIDCNQEYLFVSISARGILNKPTQFLLNDQLKPHALLEQIYLQIEQESFKILYQNQETYQKTLNYLNDFILALNTKINQEKAKQWKEQDVLEYLATNSILCKEIKQTLDQELIHIKANRPDIVKSWKYYQEFEKMCAEMD